MAVAGGHPPEVYSSQAVRVFIYSYDLRAFACAAAVYIYRAIRAARITGPALSYDRRAFRPDDPSRTRNIIPAAVSWT